MAKSKSKAMRLMCLVMAAIMTAGVVSGCADSKDSSSSKADSKVDSKVESKADDSTPQIDPETGEEIVQMKLPSAVMSTDIDFIVVAKADAELTQEIKLTVDGNDVGGELTADDCTLGGAFEGMKVTELKNDSDSITLTVSGTPKITTEFTGLNNIGTMSFDGSAFESEVPVVANVPVFLREPDKVEDPIFYPFLDAVVDNTDSLELTVILMPIGGAFKEGFSQDDITLSGEFEGAELVSFDEAVEDGDYEVVINAPVSEEPVVYGTIELAAGSVVTADGNSNEEAIIYTREYSKATEGRDLSKEDLKKIKDIVHPPKTGFMADLETSPVYKAFTYAKKGVEIYSSAMSTYKTVKGILQTFGIIDTPPSAEQQIMAQLEEIKSMITDLSVNVSKVREMTDKNTQLLRNLQKQACENYLADFNSHYYTMISLTDELAGALDRNSAKIEKLVDAYNKGGEESTTDEEIDKLITQLGAKICKLKANNYSTIGDILKDLNKEYKTTISYMKDDPTNPINRYIEIHSLTDNFTTTALTEKVLYALDIESQLDRSLSYMVLLNGEEAEKVDIDLMLNAVFPDPEEGATKKGRDWFNNYDMPYCYLLGKYVYPMPSTNFLIYSTYDGHACYLDANDKFGDKGASWQFMADEDIAEFERRMNGRTMWQELTQAGIPEDKLKFEPRKDFGEKMYNEVPGPCGVAFKVENVRIDTSSQTWKDQKSPDGKYYYFAPYFYHQTRSKNFDNTCSALDWVKTGEAGNVYAITTYGMNWGDNTFGDYTARLRLLKKSSHWNMDAGSLWGTPQLILWQNNY